MQPGPGDSRRFGRVRRKGRVAAVGVVVAALLLTVVVARSLIRFGGAASSDAAAQAALRALAEGDQPALLKLANPQLDHRGPAATQLIDACRGSDFSGSGVGVRTTDWPDVAWAELTVPRGGVKCRKLVLGLSRVNNTWYVSLGYLDKPYPQETSATDR